MRRFACLTSAAAVTALLALAPSTSATNADACSVPNRDVCVSSSSGTATNKDRDNNFSTVTQSEELGFHSSVANTSAGPQTIRWTVVLDGPGTVRDATLIDEDVALDGPGPQGADFVQRNFSFQVKHKTWPEGTYFLHATGTGGSESVTATSTFTITY
jgi:hypothetical protein